MKLSSCFFLRHDFSQSALKPDRMWQLISRLWKVLFLCFRYKFLRAPALPPGEATTETPFSPIHFCHSGQLQTRLQEYISDTFKDVRKVKDFCDRVKQWIYRRNEELERMRDIKKRANTFLGRFRKQKLEKELGQVLNNTQEGLMDLQPFLDAVEKLAVTSLSVFNEKSVQLEGVSSAAVRSIIFTTRYVSPLLINFKRDAEAYFMPNLDNVDVLIIELEKYILLTRQICRTISKNTSGLTGLNKKHSWQFSFSMSGSMLSIIEHLNNIRMDKCFRLSFLFNENAQSFMETFSECRPRLLEFLSKLEDSSVRLDKMKKGSSISCVVGSSVGAAGGVLSIVGLALAPVTAGASLALTLTGVGLGVTSGVSSIVTGITELVVNSHHGGNANNSFQKFMEDVQKILDCMEQAARSKGPVVDHDKIGTAFKSVKVIVCAGTVGKSIDALVDGASAVKVLCSKKVTGMTVCQNIPKLAKGTPLALSTAARAGFIGLNAFFIGLDAFFICKESVSLAKGTKSETSKLLRSRLSLWCREIEAWEEIYDCLWKGKDMFQKNLNILEQPLDLV